tara:strand:+ start:17 stop:829 length:813 start_codon:yes stop_codon:yes gene_type:complete
MRDTKFSENTITGHKNFKEMNGVGDAIYKTSCPRCGAVREDEQLGLEETPENYINNMVKVFRLVRKLLTDDGTLWVNIGDSYSSGKRKSTTSQSLRGNTKYGVTRPPVIEGIKQKDLIGIPWMLAFALRADGWYLRQDIIWHKPNPMPESVKDRCTKSHEYIFLLSKSPKYYFDYESIKESTVDLTGKRNKRDVWTVNVKPYKDAHFAVFPKELIDPCIKAGCPDGGIVLDPFMGSGTTAEVAVENNKKYLGCELNDTYKNLQQNRIPMI